MIFCLPVNLRSLYAVTTSYYNPPLLNLSASHPVPHRLCLLRPVLHPRVGYNSFTLEAQSRPACRPWFLPNQPLETSKMNISLSLRYRFGCWLWNIDDRKLHLTMLDSLRQHETTC